MTTGSIPVSMASVRIRLPQLTTDKNPLLYLTGVHTGQVRAAERQSDVCPRGGPRGGRGWPRLTGVDGDCEGALFS